MFIHVINLTREVVAGSEEGSFNTCSTILPIFSQGIAAALLVSTTGQGLGVFLRTISHTPVVLAPASISKLNGTRSRL